MSDQYLTGALPAPVMPQLPAPRVEELRAIALSYARAFSHNYDEQEDLASQALLSVLQYRGDIKFPKSFVYITVRNIAVSNARSAGDRELIGYELPTRETDVDTDTSLIIADTLSKLQSTLTPSEQQCYRLLCQGFEQCDLPGLLNISRQAVSQTLTSMRRKYLDIDRAENRSIKCLGSNNLRGR